MSRKIGSLLKCSRYGVLALCVMLIVSCQTSNAGKVASKKKAKSRGEGASAFGGALSNGDSENSASSNNNVAQNNSNTEEQSANNELASEGQGSEENSFANNENSENLSLTNGKQNSTQPAKNSGQENPSLDDEFGLNSADSAENGVTANATGNEAPAVDLLGGDSASGEQDIASDLLPSEEVSPVSEGQSAPDAVANAAATNAAPATDSSLPAGAPSDVAPSTVAPTSGETSHQVAPAANVLSWIAYDYDKSQPVLKIKLVTKGSPNYSLSQEKNLSGQPELIVKFHDTKLKTSLRRDIDASEFRAPVAYIRTRENPTQTEVDVILTLRDAVAPNLYAKDGDVQLTFSIPERYFGNSSAPVSPVDKASLLAVSVLPRIDASGDAPMASGAAPIPDPSAGKFEGAPPDGGEQAVLDQEPDAEEAIPPEVAPQDSDSENALPTNSSSPAGNVATNAATDTINSSSGDNGLETLNGNSEAANSALPAASTNSANGANSSSTSDKASNVGSESNNGEGDKSDNEDEFDEDGIDDFDDGDGEAPTNAEKFEV